MEEKPLIRSAPVAARVSRFEDPDGRNAFRELEADQQAAGAPGATSGRAGTANQGGSSGESASGRTEGGQYGGDRGGGVRPYQEGDFVATQVSVSAAVMLQSVILLLSVPVGWLWFLAVWIAIVDEPWYLFVAFWFGFASVAAVVCLGRSLHDRKLARIGVIAADEKPGIRRAVQLSLLATAVTFLSLVVFAARFLYA